jgi:hypothetical protein
MIADVAQLFRRELEEYLRRRARLPASETVVSLTQFANAQGEVAIPSNQVGMCLFNIDEERIMKNQGFVAAKNGERVTYFQPEVRLNLYMLFAAHFGSYEQALRYIGWTVGFFQRKRVFSPANTPAMGFGMPEVAVDLYAMTLEQQNYLWTILGAKYLPSVAYQARPVVIQEDEIELESAPVTEIELRNAHR